MKVLRGRYNGLAELFRFSSGFGWDPVTKKFTARDEVWDDYLKDLHMIFSTNVATGKNAMGLGDAIDEDTYQVGDNDGINDSNRVQVEDDEEERAYEDTSVQEVSSSLEKRRGGKLQESKEKEAEDKATNVWEAIKEIPDLEEDLRYEAMTLIHRLGMKNGFVHMSIADRKGWIIQNLRKP
ncbi:PREDICTED: uncharacterized protein At2g29880-like [Camelina sativa]|uniref:Uncharacterized protein At2g29880-like n=1 Tax=Camelina sativa TaxID=90675 RepID=A0ABM0Y4Z4_CAMSA|nr:PREDICTED: uncharacterized protein At2g29880-like [Camelina sativa]